VKLPYWSTPQQLILLADSPDGRDPLMRMFERATVPLEWLAAANLIAESPTVDFARSLLNDLKIQLFVEVITPGMAAGGIGGGCGGSWGDGSRGADWPAINQYALSLTKGTLFTSGVHPVRYYAFQSYKDREPIDCASTSKYRFLPGLLAEVSRIPFNELRLQSRIAETVVYRGRDSYLANMRMILAPLNDDFRRLVASYVRLGFLSASEALGPHAGSTNQYGDWSSPHVGIPLLLMVVDYRDFMLRSPCYGVMPRWVFDTTLDNASAINGMEAHR
jgi:hypothetical protein